MDGGAWWATVQGVEKNQTRLCDFTFTFNVAYSGQELSFTPEAYRICMKELARRFKKYGEFERP